MCCFSKPVVSVSATKIFARAEDKGRQFLVYSMSIEAGSELAMILPLPSRLPAGEKDVEFIDLKSYPQFFSDLDSGFPIAVSASSRSPSEKNGKGIDQALAVVTVGDFEASFVPSINDFSRLDERFRLADNVWRKLPGYENYSFAVFKLKPGAMTVPSNGLFLPAA